VDELVDVSGDDVADSVALGELMQGKLRIDERYIDDPGGTVGNDEFDGCPCVSLEVGFEECHFGVGEVVGAAVVKNGEVGLLVVEAVVGRVFGVSFVEARGEVGPDVVVAGCEVERDALRRDGAPFRIGGGVVAALDGVAGGDNERGIGFREFAPDLFVDSGLGFSRAVAEEDEGKRLGCGVRDAESEPNE
jgi:hypothetical protein